MEVYRAVRLTHIDKLGYFLFILLNLDQQDFASRMFRYYYRLIDKYNKPLTAYAIFTEAGTKPRPDSFEQDVETLTERSTTMGIEELLLDRATKEGIAKGREEGKIEGSHDKAIAIAKEMIKDGISAEQVAKL